MRGMVFIRLMPEVQADLNEPSKSVARRIWFFQLRISLTST